MKKQFMFILLLLCFIGSQSSTDKPERSALRVVVIDAGHGGKDPGCLSADRGTYEKDVALDIALKLRQLLTDSLDDVKVVLTRDSDRFIPLWKRADIANKNNADLFISIHCNAHRSHEPHGTETYVMGLHKNEGNLKVSKRENKSILLEEGHEDQYSDFDPESDESYILLSLFQSVYRKQSLDLAASFQSKIELNRVRKNLGVKEAGFVVLWKTTMPSILVETGFLTNPDDKKYLTSDLGKKKLAASIFESVVDLKKKWEK